MSKVLRKWANFGYQEREIRTALVFGSHGENVIIVLENDDVLAFGKNRKECLGVGVEGEVNELKRIENLCGQRIEGFECGVIAFEGEGDFCIFAISAAGTVFSWGDNLFGQLGLGTDDDDVTFTVPKKISGSLEHKKVVQVSCGGNHTLVLTSEGEVYAFGENPRGQLGFETSGENEPFPRKVGGLLDGAIVTSVACQYDTSAALLHSGEICALGLNRNDLSSSSSTSDKEWTPRKLLGLEEVVISQIVCGPYFTLALSDDGKIYSWGENDKGQLGNGTTSEECVMTPTIISTKMGRVRKIAATHYESHLCAAITENHQVYIWGNCNNGLIYNKPILTSFSSLDEVFADAFPPVTYQRFQLKIAKDCKRKGSVNERLRKAFDHPETADVAFIVEGKKIHVHKAVLTFGSDVFKKKFLGDWKDSCQKEQIVEDHSYDAFYVFLKFLYTDEVDDITLEHALDVYAIADFYQVTDLMDECENIIKSGLTVQNAAAVYEKANLFGAENLCEFCLKFCEVRWFEVLDNFETDDSRSEVILDVFRRAANQKKY
ncbi:RCC1 and BTB domain-containing protein 1-like [Cloeon dipterum]|uniref:RCC1 and BTB domain-containing protein 1-like n=1 Tax=Cloeon dipterum TaxID=197152 RepID=UPI0032204799